MGNIKTEYALPHHYIDVNCTGNELRLSDCPHNGLTHYSCHSSHNAAIFCVNGNTIISSVCICALYYRWSSSIY